MQVHQVQENQHLLQLHQIHQGLIDATKLKFNTLIVGYAYKEKNSPFYSSCIQYQESVVDYQRYILLLWIETKYPNTENLIVAFKPNKLRAYLDTTVRI